MGFGSNTGKVLYRAVGLSRVDVKAIAAERAKNKGRRAVVDVDRNNIALIVKKGPGVTGVDEGLLGGWAWMVEKFAW